MRTKAPGRPLSAKNRTRSRKRANLQSIWGAISLRCTRTRPSTMRLMAAAARRKRQGLTIPSKRTIIRWMTGCLKYRSWLIIHQLRQRPFSTEMRTKGRHLARQIKIRTAQSLNCARKCRRRLESKSLLSLIEASVTFMLVWCEVRKTWGSGLRCARRKFSLKKRQRRKPTKLQIK